MSREDRLSLWRQALGLLELLACLLVVQTVEPEVVTYLLDDDVRQRPIQAQELSAAPEPTALCRIAGAMELDDRLAFPDPTRGHIQGGLDEASPAGGVGLRVRAFDWLSPEVDHRHAASAVGHVAWGVDREVPTVRLAAQDA
jgi:hypothetical protein